MSSGGKNVSDSRPKPEIINGLLDSVYPSFALVAGMVLDLFTPLEAGPLTREQLSEALGVQASKLSPLHLFALSRRDLAKSSVAIV